MAKLDARAAEAELEALGYRQELKRSLSLADLVVYGLVFIGPIAPFTVFGFVYNASHGMPPIVYAVGLVAMVFTAFSYMTMSHEVPVAGSVYAYVARGVGETAGFLAGWAICWTTSCSPPSPMWGRRPSLHRQLFPILPKAPDDPRLHRGHHVGEPRRPADRHLGEPRPPDHPGRDPGALLRPGRDRSGAWNVAGAHLSVGAVVPTWRHQPCGSSSSARYRWRCSASWASTASPPWPKRPRAARVTSARPRSCRWCWRRCCSWSRPTWPACSSWATRRLPRATLRPRPSWWLPKRSAASRSAFWSPWAAWPSWLLRRGPWSLKPPPRASSTAWAVTASCPAGSPISAACAACRTAAFC